MLSIDSGKKKAEVMKTTTTLVALLLLTVTFSVASSAESRKPKADLDTAEVKELAKGLYEVPDSHGLLVTYIPAGEFVMGSPEDETGRGDDEVQRTVKITKPFYMGIAEVSQAQYLNAMHPDHIEYCQNKGPWGHTVPSFFAGGPWGVDRKGGVHAGLDSDKPMDMLTWEEAVAYAEWLTEREAEAGRLPEGYIYRLPTEAEWEYACRAGRQEPFGVDGELEEFFAVGVDYGSTNAPFDARKANGWGLYDMHGMLYEWVQDWYGAYDPKETEDPKGPETGEEKVIRGGCYLSYQEKDVDREATEAERLRRIRSASRSHLPADFELPLTGMRIVLGPKN